MLNYKNEIDKNRDLLISALNKNQVTFSQISKMSESLTNGNLKLYMDGTGKYFVFEYGKSRVMIELKTLRISGLKYLNNILIDDLTTKSDLAVIYQKLDEKLDWTFFDDVTLENLKNFNDMLKPLRAMYNTVNKCITFTELTKPNDEKYMMISVNGVLDINGKKIDDIVGNYDTNTLLSVEYYNEYRSELKGDKGEQGDKGDKGDKGDI